MYCLFFMGLLGVLLNSFAGNAQEAVTEVVIEAGPSSGAMMQESMMDELDAAITKISLQEAAPAGGYLPLIAQEEQDENAVPEFPFGEKTPDALRETENTEQETGLEVHSVIPDKGQSMSHLRPVLNPHMMVVSHAPSALSVPKPKAVVKKNQKKPKPDLLKRLMDAFLY